MAMDKRIKVGDVYLQLAQPVSVFEKVEASKPETPEALEQQAYIYRPNDPFQSSIDEARAIASIGPSQKPWVKKAWFYLFVIGPLVYTETYVLIMAFDGAVTNRLGFFLLANLIILPVWLLYYSIVKPKIF
jgi:hypothetical protein